MARNQQRLSQLITTFGPGAMLDLPTRSVLVGGLERWEMWDKAFKPIVEPRLVELLSRHLKETNRLAPDAFLSLRTPPLAPEYGAKDPAGIAVTVFPTWFVCEQASGADGSAREPRRRRLVRWNELAPEGGRRKFAQEDGKKVEVTPIRFVAGCERGHLQDIDWRWVVHEGTACAEPMWLEERGTSADPTDTSVVCGCGQRLSLEQAFIPRRLGKCGGQRPWLGQDAREDCDKFLRLLTRTATNTYFPQVATVISLPIGEDALTKAVERHFNDLKSANSAQEVALARRFNEVLRASLEKFPDEDVFARLQQVRAAAAADAARAPKIAEFDVFARGDATIGDNRPEARLYAETIPRERWVGDGALVVRPIKSLVAVHRLREVTCLYGFTRFEAAPTEADGDLEDVALAVNGAPLALNADWLPAIEQFGEGIFLHMDEQAVADWLDRERVRERTGELAAGHRRWAERYGKKDLRYPGTAYSMLHSLSHALVSEIAIECGYPASALKERVYALEDPTSRGAVTRCGILIYTATAGAQGTLGGLIGTVPRFSEITRSALARLAICSNDPICADHDPRASGDDRALHGSACHGCLLIAETSCEARNLFLDRALVVETMAERGAAFMQHES